MTKGRAEPWNNPQAPLMESLYITNANSTQKDSSKAELLIVNFLPRQTECFELLVDSTFEQDYASKQHLILSCTVVLFNFLFINPIVALSRALSWCRTQMFVLTTRITIGRIGLQVEMTDIVADFNLERIFSRREHVFIVLDSCFSDTHILGLYFQV